MESTDFKDIKKKYSWIGFSYFMFCVVMELSSLLISFIIKKTGISLGGNSWLKYFIGMSPIWIIGFPVTLLIANRLPSVKPEEHTIKFGNMFQLYSIITFFIITTNLIGTFITSVIEKITGLTIDNTTIDFINEQEILPSIVFAVLIGPVLEELAFRKVLIDKLGQYNKRYTIILSGVMFGLFHTNIHQFFYTTFIGILFAFVYSISGKIRYSIILHMLINTIHGIIPMALLRHIDMDQLDKVSGASAFDPEMSQEVLKLYYNPAFDLFLLYAFIIFGLIVTGLIFWIINFKKLRVDDTESPLPIGREGRKSVFLNIGIILFIIVTVAVTVIEIILMQ